MNLKSDWLKHMHKISPKHFATNCIGVWIKETDFQFLSALKALSNCYICPLKMKALFPYRIFGLLLITAFLCSAPRLSAQSVEIGGFGGFGWYRGDVGKTNHLSTSDVTFGGFLRYNLANNRYALRTHVLIGSFSNADSLSDLDYKRERNLSFKTNVQEIGALLEFNFQEYQSGTNKWMSPYIFTGLVLFRFNPTAELNGTSYDLQPLRTEGQGLTGSQQAPYKLVRLGIPLGMGYKVSIGKFAAIAVEGGFRISFTDYLDDASGNYADRTLLQTNIGTEAAALSDRSLTNTEKTGYQRANPNTNDIYGFVGMTVVLHLDFKKKDNCYFAE